MSRPNWVWLGDKLDNRARLHVCTHKEGNEDCGIHKNQGEDGSPAVAETVGDGSSQEDTDKSTTLAGLKEGALPFGRNGISSINLDAVSFLKSRERDKVAVQKHIKGLHDLVGISYRSAEDR